MNQEHKNIVVVGLGLAAAEAVKALIPKLPADHRIVAVAENEGYWPIASLRAAVVPVSSSAAASLYRGTDSKLTSG
jgi:NADH dehydrogenase FAD-containing subunit